MLIYLFVKLLYMISSNAYLFICETFIYDKVKHLSPNDKLQMLIHLLLPFQYMISSNAYLFICETFIYDKLKCLSIYL